MTLREYERLLNEFSERIEETFNIPVSIDWDASVLSDSGTGYDRDTHRANEILVEGHVPDEELNNRFGFRTKSSRVSDYVLLSGINSLFHEAQHVYQCNILAQTDTELGRELACAFLAFYDNHSFYITDHYIQIPFEINAGDTSLKNTRQLLDDSPVFDTLTPDAKDSMMTDFVNRYRADHHSFLDNLRNKDIPYNTWQEVLDDLNGNPETGKPSAYEKITNMEDKSISTYDSLPFGASSSDAVAPVFAHCTYFTEKLHDALTIVDKCKIMASVICSIMPKWKSYFHALYNVDLSMETVCGRTFTEDERTFANEARQRYKAYYRQHSTTDKTYRDCPEIMIAGRNDSEFAYE